MFNRRTNHIATAFILMLSVTQAQSQLVLIANDHIQQDSPGIDETRQLDARFGYSLASHEQQLVIGSPGALVGGEKAGAVYRLTGGDSGIFHYSGSINKYSQDTPDIPGAAENGDNFGFSVAIGMFAWADQGCLSTGYCYGYKDIIAGVPTESLSGDDDAGMANMIFPGTVDCDVNAAGNCGLLYAPLDQLYQSNAISGSSEPGDLFGFALAVGDFDGDDNDDLAIGVPGEAVNSNLATNAGAVNVVMGYRGIGLDRNNDKFLSQSTLPGGARDDEYFGYALAVGDFNGDGLDDLAIGVPTDVQTAGTNRNGGGVNIVYGSDGLFGGLTTSGAQHFDQDTDGISGGSENNDRFGHALASGDFDGDGYDDLAIGIPTEDIGNITNAGAIAILYGSSSGITASGDQFIHRDTTYVNGAAEAGDQFGYALTTGDFDGDGVDDLAVGIPFDDVDSAEDCGSVQIFHGQQDGQLFGVNRDYSFHQGSLGYPGFVSGGVRFGHSLVSGDFDKDDKDDLAVGTAGNLVTSGSMNGSVSVIYQKVFIDLIFENGFEN
ncbi:FG-GAP repeat protein [Marinicella rhabdoformis]|uniref:FG-GAP repeat protein n=1 Tax=Marinicella rhabdoformis TaxID=2580566 RepID=UPI0012AEC638|nr:FG-GAP repeat protein [Marinicella rhabdoformis]